MINKKKTTKYSGHSLKASLKHDKLKKKKIKERNVASSVNASRTKSDCMAVNHGIEKLYGNDGLEGFNNDVTE